MTSGGHCYGCRKCGYVMRKEPSRHCCGCSLTWQEFIDGRSQRQPAQQIKYGATILVTDHMVLTATEDANAILLNGDLPRHDDEPVWDYHARVRDEIDRRMAEGMTAAIDGALDADS